MGEVASASEGVPLTVASSERLLAIFERGILRGLSQVTGHCVSGSGSGRSRRGLLG